MSIRYIRYADGHIRREDSELHPWITPKGYYTPIVRVYPELDLDYTRKHREEKKANVEHAPIIEEG